MTREKTLGERVMRFFHKVVSGYSSTGSKVQDSTSVQDQAHGVPEGSSTCSEEATVCSTSPTAAPLAGSVHSQPPAPTGPQEQQQGAEADNKAQQPQQQAAAGETKGPAKMGPPADPIRDFFQELCNGHGEAARYQLREVIGKGSYGVVCSAVDVFTGEKVAIKKITSVFDHVSDATRILREIKLLRLLKHPDVVEIKHILLPPSPRDYKDIFVVFELMETDLHQVIKANDDLTPEHHQFFLYQMLRGLKYIHSAKVFHRDLKPKNILANSDCKLKICDFGLARPAFNDAPSTIFWTDYVATRWYRAPELCGSFFAKYSPAIDVWSVGCIFAEVLLGKPLFPGRNVVQQLELITDLLGTPSAEVVAKVRNEKARRFLAAMPHKPGVPFEQHFPRADPGALRILRRLLAFDPADRPSAEEALADPYFAGLHCPSREPTAQPISKLAFEFDRRKLTMDDVRELIYREVLEYHPRALQAYLGNDMRSAFMNPSAVDQFKRQFMHLEANPGAVLQGGRGGLPATSAAMHQGAGPTSASASRVPVARPPGGGGSGYLHGGGGSGSFGERGSGGAFAGAGAIAGACAVGSGEYGAAARAAAVHELQRNAGRYLHSQVSAPMPRLEDNELQALVKQAHEDGGGSRGPTANGSGSAAAAGSGYSAGEHGAAVGALSATALASQQQSMAPGNLQAASGGAISGPASTSGGAAGAAGARPQDASSCWAPAGPGAAAAAAAAACVNSKCGSSAAAVIASAFAAAPMLYRSESTN